MINYYQILGIQRDASDEEIKTAYRKLALKFHPDKNNGDQYFEERFKEIQDAYEVLSNKDKKEKFNREYDSFFNVNTKFSKSQNERDGNNSSGFSNYSEKLRKETEEKEEKERKNKENLEQERIKKIKRNTELAFEDKAWIFIGNWFIIPGLVGLIMFIKYKTEGFSKKANSVCSLTIVSFIAFLFLVIIFAIVNATNR